MRTKITVALNIPKGDNDTIVYAKHIADCMDGNPYFPSPHVPIATLRAHIAELEAAQVATLTRAHGTTTARDAKRMVVEEDLKMQRIYVQTVANQHALDGPAIVKSAGMSEKGGGGPRKPLIDIKPGPEPTSVTIWVKHPGGDASFEYQWSLDGVTFPFSAQSTKAHYVVKNLELGVVYGFRYRILIGETFRDFCDPITYRVV
jgi:hypothetical protein